MSGFDDLLRSPLVSSDVWASRRRILLAPLLAAVPLAMAGSAAQAGRIDPSQTVITLPDAMKWVPWTGLPPHSGEMAPFSGGLNEPGPYLVLVARRTGACSASTPSALMTTWRDGADISACVTRYRQGRLGMSAHARGPTA